MRLAGIVVALAPWPVRPGFTLTHVPGGVLGLSMLSIHQFRREVVRGRSFGNSIIRLLALWFLHRLSIQRVMASDPNILLGARRCLQLLLIPNRIQRQWADVVIGHHRRMNAVTSRTVGRGRYGR